MRADMKAIALLALLACRLSCQAIDAKTQILDTDAQYRNAVLRDDAAKLAIIFADDILIVHSDGGTDTKANFLDAILSGRLKLTS
jgi:ketosteroid isomerase-like protein